MELFMLDVSIDSVNPPPRLRRWVDELQAQGRYSFSKGEASKATRLVDPNLRIYLGRLVSKGRLAMPRRGFFVIVPLEHRSQGGPPAPWFLDDLMAAEGREYYVALMSAAAIHGASVPPLPALQVMVESQRRPVQVGHHRIDFFVRPAADLMPRREVKTPTGTMMVSTPASTALDLVAYQRDIGGLDRATSLISSFADQIDTYDLLLSARRASPPTFQRLGFLLEQMGKEEQVEEVEIILRSLKHDIVKLHPGVPVGDSAFSNRWLLWLNEERG
jgi:predicted transcriptional regulator of viral defense system